MPNRLAQARALSATLAKLAPSGILTLCRAIEIGDETLLTPEEAQTIPTIVAHARDASGAARFVARRLLQDCGLEGASLPRSASGAPIWPSDVVGSLAHDGCFAVASIAPASSYSSLGIDIEPAEALPDEIMDIVRTPQDRLNGVDPSLAGRLLFSAKEAVYKAAFPKDGEILGYEDITIDLSHGHGAVRNGRRFALSYCLAPRLVVIAHEPVH